ncbi:MAG TPA: glycine oxidase ThiO [Pyrinomonadaceae bacterium]|nr:glycine oxidase ThiO [Pyrinomonadaceae bacterium]
MNHSNEIPRSAEVVVIGGGVIGLTVARALVQRGVRGVHLIERSSLGAEASFAAGGMLAPQTEASGRTDFFELACLSRDLYPNFAAALREETGIDVELDTTGTLYLAFTDKDLADIQQRYEWQSQADLAVAKLDPAAVRQREPCVADSVLGALLFPKDIQVENRRLLNALINSVDKLGAGISANTNVASVTTERGRIKGVQTSRGFVSCRRVVIAAGTLSSAIQRSHTPPIEPIRGQMICFDAKPQLTRHVIFSPRGYLVPRQDGRLLAGSTSEHAGFTKQVTAGGIGSILANAHEISPAVSHLPIVDIWSGLRPRAPDGLPVLGPCGEIDGLFYATGHYRNGILLAPVTGELIAEAVVAGHVSSLLAAFSPNRFNLVHVS